MRLVLSVIGQVAMTSMFVYWFGFRVAVLAGWIEGSEREAARSEAFHFTMALVAFVGVALGLALLFAF